MLLGLIFVFFFVFRAQKVGRIYRVSFNFPTSARGETACLRSRTRASTQTLYKNQMLKMFYVFAINISKIMLEIYYSKEIATELFVFETTFSS